MDTATFDRLTSLIGRSGTRRAALSLFLGTAVLGTTLGSEAAKGPPNGKDQRRGKKKRQRGRRARSQAKTKAGNHCIAPNGVDLNERFGVSAQIVTRFCPEVGSGEQWTVGGPWFMAKTFEAVPEGFAPTGNTPLEDFIAKFTAIKYVIDPDTRHEKTVAFPAGDTLFVDNDFNGFVFVSPVTLGTLKPEPVGDHVVDVYWVFTAQHCDGIGNDPTPGVNCFPAGETRYIPDLAFNVTPGHH